MTIIEPLYDKKLECPICNNKFVSKRIRTRFVKLESTDTDFCPTYADPENNPIFYQINVCPSCGYSFSEDFSEFFPHGTKDTIKEKVCSKWNPHSFSEKRPIEDAIKTYKLAIYCATLKKEKHIILAGLYLKLAWLYRYLGNDLQEQRFMNIALQEYFNSYKTQDYQGTQVSEIRLLYLLAELSIRTGKIKDSSVYFSRIIEQQKKTDESKLVEMAKVRWNEVRHTKEFQLHTN